MSPSVLGHLTFGYQLVWSRTRQVGGVQLFIQSTRDAPVDAEHLLRVVQQAWPDHAPQLILTVPAPDLLADLLLHARPGGPWITVQHAQLAEPALATLVHDAHRRGLALLWRGEQAEREQLDTAADFDRSLISLAPVQAPPGEPTAPAAEHAAAADSALLPGQIYEDVPDRRLAAQCLDQRGAWGVAGWPVHDVLQSLQHQAPADRRTLMRILAAIDADQSLEVIGHLFEDEPLLCWRFLRHANAAVSRRHDGIESLRQGMMVLGMTQLRLWASEQLALAVDLPDLQPVRSAMVLRTRLMEQLLDPGDEDRLRNEVHLCGLLSHVGALAGVGAPEAMQGLPLSERVRTCVQDRTGAYAPFLALAQALEYPRMEDVPGLCEQHGLDIADVNRTLLRVLAGVPAAPARPR